MTVENQISMIIAVALAAFLTGLSKGGLGGMIGALVTPMLALFMPTNVAVGILLPILMLGDMFAIYAYWRRWETRLIWMLLLGALVGVTIGMGTFYTTNVPEQVLRRALGVLVLGFVLYRVLEKHILKVLHYKSRRWHGILAGGISGFISTLIHAGGPPITIYLVLQDLPPASFVATTALFFAVLNWIKVPYFYFAGLIQFDILLRLIWLAPLVPLGVFIGKRLVYRVNRVLYERLILVLLSVSGVLLLVG